MFSIEIPSLAERKEDIPVLVSHILDELKSNGSVIPTIDNSGIRALQEYIWPGNVRELKNVIERAAIIFPDSNISSKNIKENLLKVNLPDDHKEKEKLWEMTSNLTNINIENLKIQIQCLTPTIIRNGLSYLDKIDLRRHLSDVEFNLIEGALKKSNGSVTEASKCLKINRTTLIEKMKKYSIPKLGK